MGLFDDITGVTEQKKEEPGSLFGDIAPAPDGTAVAEKPTGGLFDDVLSPVDTGEFGLRPDKTKKGKGFFGVLKRIDRPKDVSSELSIGVPINGKETDIPLLVPGLTVDEMRSLLIDDVDPAKVPQSIVDKAVTHAQSRIKAGKNVFAEEGEQEKLPLEQERELRLGKEVIAKDVPPPKETVASQLFNGLASPSLTLLGAPLTIPANVVVGLVKDIKGEGSQGNVDAIRRILALSPEEGDELFVGDVLKSLNITDESLKLPEGTIDRAGLVGDFLAFGGVSRFMRTLGKAVKARNPAKIFKKEIKVNVGKSVLARAEKAKVKAEKLQQTAKEITKGKVELVPEKIAPVVHTTESLQSNPSAFKEVLANPKAHTAETVTLAKRLKSEGGFADFAKKKIVEQKFRADKLDLPPEQEAAIVKRLEALGLTQRTVRTFGEMEDAAKALGVDFDKLLKTTSTARLVDKELIALKNGIASNSDLIARKEAEILANPLKSKELQVDINRASAQINQALSKLIKGGTEAGRAVVSFRILANKTLEPAFWLKKAKEIVGKELTNEEITEMTRIIGDLIGKGDRAGLATYVASLRNPSVFEKMTILWKAGLLTSPTTHQANILGNISMAALETASDIPATGFDMLASAARMGLGKGAKRTTTITPASIVSKIKEVKRAGGKAFEYFRTGTYSDDLLQKYDLPRNISFKNKILNGYVQGVMRSLGAEDVFFREIAMQESFVKQAIVIAKNKISGGLIAKGQRKAEIAKLLREPTVQMTQTAIDVAERATFQNKNLVAEMIQSGRRAVSKKGIKGEALAAGTEIVAPFVRTPTNIAARILDFSPAGFVKAALRAIKPTNKTQELVVKDLGRAVTGSGIIALGGLLAEKGLLVGNAPISKSERDQFFAEGKRPNSILIGGEYRQLNRISPLGNLLTLGAEFDSLSQDRDLVGTGIASTGSAMKTLTDQTFLKGVSGAVKAINNPERNAQAYINQMIASTVPSIIGKAAKTVDPISRRPEGIRESVENRIPFLSKNLAVRRDSLGNAVKTSSGRATLVDPFASTEVVDNPVLNEARNAGVFIGLPSQTISGAKLTNLEYSRFQKFQGMWLERHLEETMNSSQYQSASNAEKADMIDKSVRLIRSVANDTLFPALMIERYKLPTDTDPGLLRQVLSEFNNIPKFKNANKAEQSRLIKGFFRTQSK